MVTVDARGFPITGSTAVTTPTSTQLTSSVGGKLQDTTQQFGTSIENQQNMTPQSLAALEALIATMRGGGTLQQKSEVARKKQTQDLIQQMLGQYSTGQAFTDAQGLMALNLQKAMEANKPAIQRAVEGAGTSASSMQGLLSQNMARDAALAASALGGEQAKAYGGITANLTGQLSQMASQAMDPAGEALLKALGIAKGAVQNTQRYTSGGGTSTTGAGTGRSGMTTGGGGETISGGSNIPSGATSWAGSDTPWGIAQSKLKEPNVYSQNRGTNYGGMTISDYLLSQ